MAFCCPGAFSYLWGRNIRPTWPEPCPLGIYETRRPGRACLGPAPTASGSGKPITTYFIDWPHPAKTRTLRSITLLSVHGQRGCRGSPKANPSRPPRGPICSKPDARHLASHTTICYTVHGVVYTVGGQILPQRWGEDHERNKSNFIFVNRPGTSFAKKEINRPRLPKLGG